MTPYANLGGNSGVSEYMLGDGLIKLRFGRSAVIYVYDASKPGPDDVANMQRLAVEGQGLATYVNQNVRKNFARTERLA